MGVLITGGTGFLGSNLAHFLLDRGNKIVLFDSFIHTERIEEIKDRITLVQGDLSCWPEVINAVAKHKISTIYHLGALLSQSAEDAPFKGYDVNINGSYNIMEAARLFSVSKVIYTSSIASFGLFMTDPVFNETPQYPLTMYGVSKVFTERLGIYYSHRFGLDFRAVRFPSVIGPGRGAGGASAYSTLMIEYPALGKPYDVFVEPRARIPILYIKDAVRALVGLHDAPADSLTRRCYNVAGISPTAREITDVVLEYLPEGRIDFKPDAAMMAIVDSWPDQMDDSVAEADWGWKNRYDLKKTVRDFINEVKDS